ncbi:MAG TPA: glycosyltransferase family 87 protein [Acidobacteriota bacterium]|nr:glycosyltransferase family 87 protein [Acidobacteriota bacterium]
MIEEVSKTEKSALLAWFYSPVFLLLVYPLAFLPFKAALLIWNILTLGLYLLAIHRIYPHKAALFAALAFPGVFFNLLWSQNGFLTAFLLGTGMLFIHKNGYIRHSPQ